MTYYPEKWSCEFNGIEYYSNHKIDFANQLKRLRVKNNISHEKLAEAIKSTKLTLINYEKKNNKPNLETACRLSVYFGVTLDELVYGHIPNGISGYTESEER